MNTKTYRYVNDLGRRKEIVIRENKGKCHFIIWDLQTGEMSSSGETTFKEIRNFLKHYSNVEEIK